MYGNALEYFMLATGVFTVGGFQLIRPISNSTNNNSAHGLINQAIEMNQVIVVAVVVITIIIIIIIIIVLTNTVSISNKYCAGAGRS